jgi:Icc-related predicted phosphoesterase
MTILHLTDLHFNKRWFNWLPNNAPAHDLLILSGDLLNLSDLTAHTDQIAWVADWINDYPRPLCVCSGPSDLEWDGAVERWTPAYWLRNFANRQAWADGTRVSFNNLSVLNIGCTTHPKGGDADIWVVHTPPARTAVSTHVNGRDSGDSELVAAVRRHAPRVVLSGHVHDPLDWHTRHGPTLLMNPGRSHDTPVPNHIILNTEDMSAEFITATRRERLTPVGSVRSPAVLNEDRLVSATA